VLRRLLGVSGAGQGEDRAADLVRGKA
jgi:hypothetical protein